jgi:DNA-binding PadR family transcriptional regulator
VLITVDRELAKKTQWMCLRGLLELILLKMLCAEPMHGYQIIQNCRKAFNIYFGPSTIYPALISLQKQGYVTSDWELAPTRGRPKKVYHITPKGENLAKLLANNVQLVCTKLGI